MMISWWLCLEQVLTQGPGWLAGLALGFGLAVAQLQGQEAVSTVALRLALWVESLAL